MMKLNKDGKIDTSKTTVDQDGRSMYFITCHFRRVYFPISRIGLQFNFITS